LFADATFKLFFGEVLGVLGRNGAGKSTLLRLLAGQLAPAAGRIQVAAGTRVGFFTQEMTDLPQGGTVLEAMRALDARATEQELRDHLGLFWFSGDDVERPVASLSGGEKRRLCLARLTRSAHDVLLLDEPTNHLDIATREGLEQAVLGFQGSTVVVSHDRQFLETVADRVLYVAGGAVRAFDRGLEHCLETLAAERRAAAAQARPAAREREAEPPRPRAADGKIRNPHQFAKLEKRIMALEAELESLRAAMTLPESWGNAARMKELTEREAALGRELAESYERWEKW
jgi:ATP-binding cassette subfamily F protein 3